MTSSKKKQHRSQDDLMYAVRTLTASISGFTNTFDVEGLSDEQKSHFVSLKRLVDSLVTQLANTEKDLSPTPPIEAEHPKLKILVAEDDEDNIFLLKSFLKEGSFDLHFARDGAEAVKEFQSGAYDLILMDMKMPVMDGSTATKSIRYWEKQQGKLPVPIVAVSAVMKEGKETMMNSGCNKFISKPFKKSELFETIDRVWAERMKNPKAIA